MRRGSFSPSGVRLRRDRIGISWIGGGGRRGRVKTGVGVRGESKHEIDIFSVR